MPDIINLQTCPVCCASLNEQSRCRRCDSDLVILKNIQLQSRNQLVAALTHGHNGDTNRAYHCLESAKRLSNDGLTQSVICLMSKQLTPKFSSSGNTKSDRITWLPTHEYLTTSEYFKLATGFYAKLVMIGSKMMS